MDKYYIGKGTINGRKVVSGHTIANFTGTLEEAAVMIGQANPGIENFELTENGDNSSGAPRMLQAPPAPSQDEDFAEAMMSKPRTVKVKTPDAAPADPQGRKFNPATGIPSEAVPASQVSSIK